jgi:hypothetical protein
MKTKRDISMYPCEKNIQINLKKWKSSPTRIKTCHHYSHPPNYKHALNKLGRNGKENLSILWDMQISLLGLWTLTGSRERYLCHGDSIGAMETHGQWNNTCKISI